MPYVPFGDRNRIESISEVPDVYRHWVRVPYAAWASGIEAAASASVTAAAASASAAYGARRRDQEPAAASRTPPPIAPFALP